MHPLGNIATLSCPLITYWLYHIKPAVIRTGVTECCSWFYYCALSQNYTFRCGLILKFRNDIHSKKLRTQTLWISYHLNVIIKMYVISCYNHDSDFESTYVIISELWLAVTYPVVKAMEIYCSFSYCLVSFEVVNVCGACFLDGLICPYIVACILFCTKRDVQPL